jgi:hypothetical protein
MGEVEVDDASDTGPYAKVLRFLADAGAPFLVGGGYALEHYTRIVREPRDLDLFVRKRDHAAVLATLAARGCAVQEVRSHWLGKVALDGRVVDVIYSSGNGVVGVDDGWFEHAPAAEVLGVPVRLCPVEEMVWSKAFVMERERYDGADVMHLVLACAGVLDWGRLLRRFGPNWRVLLGHLVLFGFIYPSERERVPEWVMEALLRRLRRERRLRPGGRPVCRGTLLSRQQYLVDIQEGGLEDARVPPHGRMRGHEIAEWTAGIDGEPPRLLRGA